MLCPFGDSLKVASKKDLCFGKYFGIKNEECFFYETQSSLILSVKRSSHVQAPVGIPFFQARRPTDIHSFP